MNPRVWRWTVPSLGLALGLALGLVYSWVIDPVQLINTYPGLLRSDYRTDWARLAALSYIADGDLDRAQARLASLESDDITRALESLIEEYAAAGQTAEVMRNLTALAESLGANTPAMLVYAPTSLDAPTTQPTPTPTQTATRTPLPPTTAPSPSPTITPSFTPTPQVTATPDVTYQSLLPSPSLTISPANTPSPPTVTPTPVLVFQLVQKEQICDIDTPTRIEVWVQDEDEEPLDGIQVWLIWDDGADRAVTGLKPTLGPGYADFQADSDLTYGLGVGELGQLVVTRLKLETCVDQDTGARSTGGWRIVFQLALVQTE